MSDEAERGHRAYRDHQWQEAFSLLTAADAVEPLSGDGLVELSTAAYMLGRAPQWRSGLERAYRAHRGSGEHLAAARDAFWLGFYLASRGETGPSSGWLTRARRLVDAAGSECVEQGYLLLPRALAHRLTGEYDAAQDVAADAAKIGEQFGDPDLLCWARHEEGRSLVSLGRVAEGLTLLDEAMVSVTAGECTPLVTGQVYCSVIEACLEAYEVRRASQWTTALARWCEDQPNEVPYTGQCLVHRAQIMRLHGSWPDAFDEALRASERFALGAEQPAAAAALYEQAEFHRLVGRHADAEAAYLEAYRAGQQPQPGFALLRLAQGHAEEAAATMRRALAERTDRLARARLIGAYVQTMLAVGDQVEARAACAELAGIAETYATDLLAAIAVHCRAQVSLGDGEVGDSLRLARRAAELWQRIGAPYEVARARELIAQACASLGDVDGADLEFEAARSAFADLGARDDEHRVEHLMQRSVPDGTGALTGRELEVLRLLAQGDTNRSIADRLSVSERTIDRHVSNILTKLTVSSRTAAAAYAFEHRLI